jgi:hypothetical protein
VSSFEDKLTGDVVNDQIYTRNKMVEDALNIDLYVEMGETIHTWAPTLNAQVSAGWTEGDFNYFGTHGRTGLTQAQNGSLADLGSYDEINIYRSYWEQPLLDAVMLDDSIYALLGEISLVDQVSVDVFLFNKNLFKQNGLDEPYDLVRAHEWTVDKMLDYMDGFAKDYDGNGYELGEDLFNVVGNYANATNAIFYSSGFTFCVNDGDTITMDFDKDECDELVDTLLSVWGKNSAYVSHLPNNSTDTTEVYSVFKDNRSLFVACYLSEIPEQFSEMESDYGVLPSPMHSDTQDKYYSYMFYGAPMAVVPVTDPNPQRTGNIMEALCAASHDVVIPKGWEIVTKIRNIRDEDSAEMIEIARENKVYDMAHWLNLPGFEFFSVEMVKEKQNITGSYLKMYQGKAEKELANFIKSYEDLKK